MLTSHPNIICLVVHQSLTFPSPSLLTHLLRGVCTWATVSSYQVKSGPFTVFFPWIVDLLGFTSPPSALLCLSWRQCISSRILPHLSGVLARARGQCQGTVLLTPLPIISVRLLMADKNGICEPKFHHVTPYKIPSQGSGIKGDWHSGSFSSFLPHYQCYSTLA